MQEKTRQQAGSLTLSFDEGDFLVRVYDDGKFVAEYKGEEYAADSLASLRHQLKSAAIASWHEIPFADSETGRTGIIRGWHAGTHDILVTWADGRKDRISHHRRVWKKGEIEQETLSEINRLLTVIADATGQVKELRSSARQASELLAEAIGEDITDYRWQPPEA